MPITKKVVKSENEQLLKLLPDKNKYEVTVGHNIYELYALPAKKFMALMTVVRKIWKDLEMKKAFDREAVLKGAKMLSSKIGEISDADVKVEVTKLVQKLSSTTDVEPYDFVFSPELASELDQMLDVVLEGVDKEDREALTAPQLSDIAQCVFLLNFVGFIRVLRNASQLFRDREEN